MKKQLEISARNASFKMFTEYIPPNLHNAMFREAFNKVQDTGSNRDFGTTKAARMYFSMSEPSPAGNPFSKTDVKPPSFQ